MKLAKMLKMIGFGLMVMVLAGIAISFLFKIIYEFFHTPWSLIALIGAALFVAGKILSKKEDVLIEKIKTIAESK